MIQAPKRMLKMVPRSGLEAGDSKNKRSFLHFSLDVFWCCNSVASSYEYFVVLCKTCKTLNSCIMHFYFEHNFLCLFSKGTCIFALVQDGYLGRDPYHDACCFSMQIASYTSTKACAPRTGRENALIHAQVARLSCLTLRGYLLGSCNEFGMEVYGCVRPNSGNINLRCHRPGPSLRA